MNNYNVLMFYSNMKVWINIKFVYHFNYIELWIYLKYKYILTI